MSEIRFDEVKHRYFLDSREIPGVTSILKGAGIIDTSWYNNVACQRGTYVHRAICFHNRGTLDESTLSPILAPYLGAYTRFLRESGFTPMRWEEIVYTSQYAGTFDILGQLNGIYVLIDIKTGSMPKWAGLQTQAYAAAVECMPDHKLKPQKRLGLQLKDTGAYSLTEFSDPRDASTWAACLAIWNYKN